MVITHAHYTYTHSIKLLRKMRKIWKSTDGLLDICIIAKQFSALEMVRTMRKQSCVMCLVLCLFYWISIQVLCQSNKMVEWSFRYRCHSTLIRHVFVWSSEHGNWMENDTRLQSYMPNIEHGTLNIENIDFLQNIFITYNFTIWIHFLESSIRYIAAGVFPCSATLFVQCLSRYNTSIQYPIIFNKQSYRKYDWQQSIPWEYTYHKRFQSQSTSEINEWAWEKKKKTMKNENYTVYPIPIQFTRLHNKYMRRLFGKTDDNNNNN